MKRSRKKSKSFRDMLRMYLNIKGLDIIIQLKDGTELVLNKNRVLKDDMIVINEHGRGETVIPLDKIATVELYAA